MSADQVDSGAPCERGGRPPGLKADAHKGDAGRVLVIAGSREMPGAAILCARAALRGGAGLVTLACLDPELMALAPAAVPEAILWDLSVGKDEVKDSGFVRPDLDLYRDVKEGLEGRPLDAVVLGPGMGNTPRTAHVVRAVLDMWRGALVIDADGLNVIAGEPMLGQAVRDRGKEPKRPLDMRPKHATSTVLTPHPGEARGLAGRDVGALSEERIEIATAIARDLCSIVCLKGAGTVVTNSVLTAVNPTGNPGMATAGSGDVLAGLTAAYLAQVTADFTPFDAARAAVFVHGHAGDMAAAALGQRALIASDLVDHLGRAEEDAAWA
ncbi:MAG: NAD(P)H-hydrate dehydratase [Planctomycetota bacterium]|nr:NAD(P)H-hydrate dehydratase [Planctomycetota bacterium]